MVRAVHRAQDVDLIVHLHRGEHILLVVIPVAGGLIKLDRADAGREHVLIAQLELLVADIVFQNAPDRVALGQEHRKAPADQLVGHEQAQLAAELAVVAQLGLLELGKVLVQLVLLREGDAVDALKRFTLAVAAPVGGVAGGQLDGVALDAAGGIEVRAGAEVGELTLLIEADVRVGGQIVDELDLERLVLLLHELDGFLARQLKALELELFLADLAHLRLDLLQMLRRKGAGSAQIVVEAGLDAGADGELHLGPQALDRLRQHMGAGVPIGLAVLGIFKAVLVFFVDLDFFGHFSYLHLTLRVQKCFTPDGIRGEALLYSTVPPCLRVCAACVRCNGRTRPARRGLLGSGTTAAHAGRLHRNASLSVRCSAVSSPSMPV